MIYADPCTSKPARRNEALSPAEFKSLPDEARADLRRLYHNLEITFSIPKVDLTNLLQPDAYDGFSAPGHLPRDHPANDDNDEEDNGHTGSPSDPGAVDVSPPWLPLLMLFGRATLSATFRDWLSHWRKRSKCTNPGHILHSAAKREEAFTPVGAVAAWLTDSGWDGSTLSPAAARTWLARWNADQTQRRAAALSPWERGAGAERPTLPQQYRLGREIFKKAHMMSGIRAADGTWQEKVDVVDAILWASRAHIWQTAPAFPDCGRNTQDHYFSWGRTLDVEATPKPKWGKLASLVLAPSGSAPGVDGEPYEFYHLGVRFVVCLIAQAWYAAERCPGQLRRVLGPAVSLLVWILKKADAEHPNDMRPLQLATHLHGKTVWRHARRPPGAAGRTPTSTRPGGEKRWAVRPQHRSRHGTSGKGPATNGSTWNSLEHTTR